MTFPLDCRNPNDHTHRGNEISQDSLSLRTCSSLCQSTLYSALFFIARKQVDVQPKPNSYRFVTGIVQLSKGNKELIFYLPNFGMFSFFSPNQSSTYTYIPLS